MSIVRFLRCNVVVEVLVCQPAQKLPLAPGEEPITDSVRRPAILVHALRFIDALTAAGEILFQLGLVPQIISDYLIDVGEGGGRILLCDLFGGSALQESSHQAIQTDPRAAHPYYTIGSPNKSLCFRRKRFSRRFPSLIG